ncbi:uncharacterized protein LOC126380383 isoform X3 [Pectinophora gossypiella]|uniref:uncharacterized protein LOC126380383 isoform X3 n=1 Tax=Pectinophora gossypiella TaxID=13191 RepID=UPI00214EAFA1|nr:uncharacterized protein LOC126380383 isoform X3 [Pectinophora gossypiella]
MKSMCILICLVSLVYTKTLVAHQSLFSGQRCVNMWDEGCINSQLGGSGSDDHYLGGGGFNPGKRCVNMWDDGCINGQLGGAGSDDNFLGGGGFNPGKRCVNMWDDGCINGQLGGAGSDDNFLGGGGFNPGKRSLHNLIAKLHKTHNKIN